MSSVKQMYDDLLMAKNLLDQGILTQEEYEREKRTIMARRSDPSRATRASSGPRAQPAVVTPKRPRTVSFYRTVVCCFRIHERHVHAFFWWNGELG